MSNEMKYNGSDFRSRIRTVGISKVVNLEGLNLPVEELTPRVSAILVQAGKLMQRARVMETELDGILSDLYRFESGETGDPADVPAPPGAPERTIVMAGGAKITVAVGDPERSAADGVIHE